jgi:NitT/TauT family transport system substrate-binding protein
MMFRQSIASLGFIALVTMYGSSCKKNESTSGASGGKSTVKLVLNWVPEPEFGGFYAARDGGAYAKQNLDVVITGGGAGVPVLQMVASGQVDFGIAGADEVLMARARGVDIVALFSVYQTSPQGIMAHASRGATKIKDLLGSGTLALGLGMPYAAYLKNKYGFEGVQIVPYDGGVARFVSDKNFAQQCFITAEPIAAKSKGAETTVFLVADEGFNPYTGVIITRRELVEKNKAMVTGFVKASREGWQNYLVDPKPANATMAKLNTAMDADTFAAAAEAQKPLIETAETKTRGIGSMTKERWDTLANQMVELKLIDKAPNTSDFLVTVE